MLSMLLNYAIIVNLNNSIFKADGFPKVFISASPL